MEENKNQSEDFELQKSTASPTHHQIDSCMSLGDMNKEVGCRLDDCTTDDALLCPHNQANHEGKANQTHSPGKKRKVLDTSDGPVPMKRSCSINFLAKHQRGAAPLTDPSLADGYTCRLKEMGVTKEQSGRGSIESSMADDVNSSNDTFKVPNIVDLPMGAACSTDPSLADGYTCRLKETRLTKEQSGRGSIESSMADDVNSSNDTFKSSCFPPWDHVKKKFKRKRQGHKEANTNLGKEHEKK